MTAALISQPRSLHLTFDDWAFHLNVSRRVSRARPALSEVARLLLQVPGVLSVELTLPASLGGNRTWRTGMAHNNVATVAAGPVQVGFVSGQERYDVVEFVAQQISMAAERQQMSDERDRLLKQKDTLAKRMETRKFYLRASALLQTHRKLTEKQSYLFLLKSARSLRRSLLQVSRTVIAMEEPVVPITRKPRRRYGR